MRRLVDKLFNRLRFNQKLFLSYLTVIIIPILVLGMYAYRQSLEMLEFQERQAVARSVDTLSESMNSKLEQYNYTIQSMAYNRTFQRIVANDYLDLVNLSRDLNEYLTPYFNMMMMMDKQIKKITFYTQSDVPEYGDSVYSYERVKDEVWYAETVSGEGSGWYFVDDDVIVVKRFPRFFSDPYTNVVAVRIRNESLFRNMPDVMNEYGVMLSDGHNRLLYANRNAAGYGPPETLEALLRMEGKALINGTDMMIVKKAIPETGWMIHSFVPDRHSSRQAGSIINATFIVIASCIVFLLVIISIFSRTMIRRIHRLNSLMKRVENGDLKLHVKSSSRDEIGELTNRFGNMIIRLNELIEESYAGKIIQKEAELKALQSQIRPHFLYNTLSFMNWEAVKSGQRVISHVATTLAKFYRTSLNKGDNVIPIRDELDNVKSYLDIILVMNGYSFDVRYDIDDEVYSYSMLNLILQPLAENAVIHGVNKKESGRGMLQLSAKLADRRIEFTIADNGPGMDEETRNQLLSRQSNGYGLKNVHKRLQLFFGAEYGIEVRSESGSGTTMKVSIPQYIETP
ncbi:cache domain-containing sensor histidine kinase [Paenibacillus thermotolerans]|uniref:cache domain-containing sensor histidine kinase n=1 Tax=Paenibacillus thermotolerans TaxID=3027807 RepID=UPI00236870D2|nr:MULTISPECIES: histidine kinase [unclassified Paenibacillus]